MRDGDDLGEGDDGRAEHERDPAGGAEQRRDAARRRAHEQEAEEERDHSRGGGDGRAGAVARPERGAPALLLGDQRPAAAPDDPRPRRNDEPSRVGGDPAAVDRNELHGVPPPMSEEQVEEVVLARRDRHRPAHAPLDRLRRAYDAVRLGEVVQHDVPWVGPDRRPVVPVHVRQARRLRVHGEERQRQGDGGHRRDAPADPAPLEHRPPGRGREGDGRDHEPAAPGIPRHEEREDDDEDERRAREHGDHRRLPSPDDVPDHEHRAHHEQRSRDRPVPREGGVRADLELPRRVGARDVLAAQDEPELEPAAERTASELDESEREHDHRGRADRDEHRVAHVPSGQPDDQADREHGDCDAAVQGEDADVARPGEVDEREHVAADRRHHREERELLLLVRVLGEPAVGFARLDQIDEVPRGAEEKPGDPRAGERRVTPPWRADERDESEQRQRDQRRELRRQRHPE